MKNLYLILLIVMLLGCEKDSPVSIKWQEVNLHNIEKCEKAGGYPIRSVWDNHMVECQMVKDKP